ncbi:hypothetical protein MMC14_002622 [Varicellaria rhodocarpa]|nr:hypothetical protein [Varicellaria rhodocarpa]
MHLDLGLPQFLSSRSQVTDKQLHTYEEDDELPLTTVEAVYLGGASEHALPNGNSPEASAARGVRLFCESGGPNNTGEEVLHLPIIVESAESSPSAAKEAANVIRKFLSKENFQRAYVQYNAIMLVRILAENPGPTFTRNLDTKFVITTKELLRDGRDMSVQQILRETLDAFETQKPEDETLKPLLTMWQKEKTRPNINTVLPVARSLNAPPFNPNQQYHQYDSSLAHNPNNNRQHNYFSRSHSTSRGLPPPIELASRIEEAKTSAKLLLQVVQTTPPNELSGNELIKEFADRCQSASRSIQGYINADNPAPDDDTLLTLIETNDLLASALSKNQRAMLQARRFQTPPNIPSSTPSPLVTPPLPPPRNGVSRSPPAIPPPGPPPQLKIPQPPQLNQKLTNGSYQGQQVPDTNGLSATSGPLPTLMAEDSLGSQSNAYHPAYKSTPSYVYRQELSRGNLTMHGAATEEDEEVSSPEEARAPKQYRF